MSYTVSSRLAELTGLSGATLAQHLRALAPSATTVSAALFAYSGLTGATMAAHLLVDPPRGGIYPRLRRSRR